MQLETLGANLIVLIVPAIIFIIAFVIWRDKRLVKMAVRNLGRRKTRNFLTVIGVMASVSLYVAFNIASDNTHQIVYNIVELLGGKVDFEVSRIDGQPFDETILGDILEVEGVKAAAPRIQRYCIIYVNADGNSTAATVVGIDPKYDNEFGDLFNAENESEVINDLVTGKNVIVSEQLMDGITWGEEKDGNIEIVNATVGDTLKLKYRSSGGSVKTKIWDLAAFAEVTGKVRQVSYGSNVFITLDSAQNFFPKCRGKVDQIVVELDEAYSDQWQDVQQRIKEVVGDENITVFAPKQNILEQNEASLEGMNAGLLFAGVTTLLAMIFLIFNAISMTISERKYEIGVLRSIGFKKRHIFRLFLYEVLILGTAGSAIGVFLGVWISQGLLLYFKQLINAPIEIAAAEVATLPVDLGDLRNGFFIGIIFSFIGGLYPLLSVSAIPIIGALRPEARTVEKPTLKHRLRWLTGGSILAVVGVSLLFALTFVIGIENSFLTGIFLILTAAGIIVMTGGLKRKHLTIVAGVVLLAIGLVDVIFIGSFFSSYILMVGSIILTAGILRGISGFFYFITKRIPGLKYVGSLASKNIARNPTRSTLTFGIFTICLALVISIASILVAIQTGILQWVDNNLDEDMWITTSVGAPLTLGGNITRNIEGIHWENTSEGMIPACTAQLFEGAHFDLWDNDYDSLLIGINSTQYYVVNKHTLQHNILEPNNTDIYKLFTRLKNPHENSCIISDRLAEELHVKVGQKTPIRIDSHFNSTEFKVIGIMHNDIIGYPRAGYFAIIDIDKLLDFGFEDTAYYFSLKLDKNYPNGTEVDPQVVADQIDERWGDEYKLTFSFKEGVKDDIREQVQQIGIFFNIITYSSIIVGLLVLITTMIKIVSERRREIGLLRTIGIKKAKVMQLILFESVFLALIGLFLGILDGYILGYTFVQAIGSIGFGTVEFVMPWGAIGQTVVVALVIAVIGAIIPAWQAGRIPPAESLRYTG
ncbi:MAG: FtsX-like permease family protein [Promethearchaeota archaeon]